MDGQKVTLLELMRLHSMIDDGPRLVEDACTSGSSQPVKVVGFGAFEQFSAPAPFALAPQLGIEKSDSLHDAAMERHVAAERIFASAIHAERVVPEVLIAEKSCDFRARDDPLR